MWGRALWGMGVGRCGDRVGSGGVRVGRVRGEGGGGCGCRTWGGSGPGTVLHRGLRSLDLTVTPKIGPGWNQGLSREIPGQTTPVPSTDFGGSPHRFGSKVTLRDGGRTRLGSGFGVREPVQKKSPEGVSRDPAGEAKGPEPPAQDRSLGLSGRARKGGRYTTRTSSNSPSPPTRSPSSPPSSSAVSTGFRSLGPFTWGSTGTSPTWGVGYLVSLFSEVRGVGLRGE